MFPLVKPPYPPPLPQQQRRASPPPVASPPATLPAGATPHDLVLGLREARRLLAEAGEAGGPLPCAGCQRPAPFEAAFCAGCGARLRFPCPRCEATCRQGDAWCGGCGVELERGLVADRLAALERAAEEERRRRERAPLRAYASTRVTAEHPVRHVVGTRHDGTKEFVKLAHTPHGRRLLEGELAALTTIGAHPGVVAVKEHREHDGALVVVFEHHAPEQIRFPVAIPRLLEVVDGVLAALEHVHGRGIVHCDLKPKHVLLVERGPLLIDWNIAQAPGSSRFGAYTPLFAAPEQIVGDRIDARTDLYALGVMLYLLFTHDRFPAVLEERKEPEPLLEVLQAKKAMNRAYLTSVTQYGGKLARLQAVQQAQPGVAAPGGGAGDVEARRVLGAKYLFTSELQRTHDVNAEIRLTGAVLEVVRRATAVDPADRFADAASMRRAVRSLLARCGRGGAA